MPAAKLTKRQQEMFEFIAQFRAHKKYNPSVREIAAEFDISPQTAHEHLDAMVEKGVLTRDPGKQRSIRTP